MTLLVVVLSGASCSSPSGTPIGVASTSTAPTTALPSTPTSSLEPQSLYVSSTQGSLVASSDYRSIPEAIAAARSGDEIVLRPGIHLVAGDLAFGKRLTLRSEVPRAAVITASLEPPRDQRNETLPLAGLIVGGEEADGSQVLDITFENIGDSFSGAALRVERVRDVVVRGNSFRYTASQAVRLFDTQDVVVAENEFLNPYLVEDVPNAIGALPEGRTTNESYMDYGVLIYGSIRPVIERNYFFGVFHQALSFKEGNTDARASQNTFDGFAYTALFVGQNKPGGNSFSRFASPESGPDGGIITVSSNLFRPVADEFGEYLNANAIRVGYVNADIYVTGNIVEAAFTPFQVDCNNGGSPTCAQGTLALTDNLLNGTVVDRAGDAARYDEAGCLHLRDVGGGELRVTITGNTLIGCGKAFELADIEFVLNDNLIVDMTKAADGRPASASGNVRWNAAGDFGGDAVDVDPGIVATSIPLGAPSPRLEGAVGWVSALTPSAGFRAQWSAGA